MTRLSSSLIDVPPKHWDKMKESFLGTVLENEPFQPLTPPSPFYPRACGGAVAEGLKKEIPINNHDAVRRTPASFMLALVTSAQREKLKPPAERFAPQTIPSLTFA